MAAAAAAGVLFAGSYERFLFGFTTSEQEGKAAATPALVKTKTYAAHQGPVRCCAGAGHFVVSGGQDDLIHLYNVKTGQDLGFLVNPGRGAITCLEFFVPAAAAGAPSHLLSGSEDGTISIWQVAGDWTHLKQLGGHEGAVTSLAVHPSGRLALSISRTEGSIRMWDLVKGRCHYTTKLDRQADLVRWSPSGQTYALVCDTLVTLHLAGGSGQLLATLKHPRRITTLLMPSDNVVVTGAEDGTVRVWDVPATPTAAAAAPGAAPAASAHTLETPSYAVSPAHATRIRGMSAIGKVGANGLPAMVATCCSAGVIKLWDMSGIPSTPGARDDGAGAMCVATASTTARLTCLCVADPAAARSIPAAQAKATAAPKAAAVPALKLKPGQSPAAAAAAAKREKPKAAAAAAAAAASLKRARPPTAASDGFEIVSANRTAQPKRAQPASSSDDDSDSDSDGGGGGAAPAQVTARPQQKKRHQGQAQRQKAAAAAAAAGSGSAAAAAPQPQQKAAAAAAAAAAGGGQGKKKRRLGLDGKYSGPKTVPATAPPAMTAAAPVPAAPAAVSEPAPHKGATGRKAHKAAAAPPSSSPAAPAAKPVHRPQKARPLAAEGAAVHGSPSAGGGGGGGSGAGGSGAALGVAPGSGVVKKKKGPGGGSAGAAAAKLAGWAAAPSVGTSAAPGSKPVKKTPTAQQTHRPRSKGGRK